MHYSRLQRRNERLSLRQSYLLVAASLVILVLFVLFGFPAILNLAGTIGNLSGKKVTTTADRSLAPAVPQFSQDFEATKSAQITLNGVADGKVSVEIFQNERSLGVTLAKEDGSFSMDVDLSKGANIFTAIAISQTGQKSAVSDSYIVSFLSSPPKLEVTSPKDGDNLKDSQVTVLGKSDPNTNVTVNDHLAIVSGDGSFTYNFNLSNGDNKIKIVSTDKAGNQSTKEITVKYNP